MLQLSLAFLLERILVDLLQTISVKQFNRGYCSGDNLFKSFGRTVVDYFGSTFVGKCGNKSLPGPSKLEMAPLNFRRRRYQEARSKRFTEKDQTIPGFYEFGKMTNLSTYFLTISLNSVPSFMLNSTFFRFMSFKHQGHNC